MDWPQALERQYTHNTSLRNERSMIKEELINTEERLVDVIKTIVHDYKGKMLDSPRRPKELTLEDIDVVFINIEQLIPVHQKIVEKLKYVNLPVGVVMEEMAEELLVYATFRARLPQACKKLEDVMANTKVNAFVEKLKTQSSIPKSELKSLLLSCGSQLPRCVRLMDQLEENIRRGVLEENTPGDPSLSRALGLIKDVAKFIDVACRQWVEQQDYDELLSQLTEKTDSRNTLLRSFGAIVDCADVKVKRTGTTRQAAAAAARPAEKRFIYAFDGAVIVTQPGQAGFLGRGAVAYRWLYHLDLTEFTFQPSEFKSEDVGIDFFQHEKSEFNCTLLFKTRKLRDRWQILFAGIQKRLMPAKTANGHEWVLTTFDHTQAPAALRCAVCGLLLWGVVSQGYECRRDRTRVHKHCMAKAEVFRPYPAHLVLGITEEGMREVLERVGFPYEWASRVNVPAGDGSGQVQMQHHDSVKHTKVRCHLSLVLSHTCCCVPSSHVSP